MTYYLYVFATDHASVHMYATEAEVVARFHDLTLAASSHNVQSIILTANGAFVSGWCGWPQ